MSDPLVTEPLPGPAGEPIRPALAEETVAPGRSRQGMMAAAAVALLAIGIGAGSAGTALFHPRDAAFLMKPTPVAQLRDGSDVAISGKVAEVYGNKFIVVDATGRTLVDAGWRGEGGDLVKPGEQLVVKGHFERGFIHGDLLVRANGKAETLKPPHPGPRGWGERLKGPRIAASGVPG